MFRLRQHILIFLVISLAFGSCRSSRSVSINAVQPAELNVHPDIKTLLILDRTEHSKRALAILEGVLTGEGPGEDKAAVQEAMNSLMQNLHGSYRFNVKIAPERLKGNSLTSALPSQLSWNLVNTLCKRYGADAMIAFETFDSDFIITRGKKEPRKVTDPKTDQVTYIDQYYAEGVADVKIGLRFYDPISLQVIDQQTFQQSRTWQKTATSEAQAVAQLINKARATQMLSAGLGGDYAYRISPMPIRISRSYYRKGKKSPSLEMGARMAEVNNWQGAMETWKSGLRGAGMKEAGYLTHNIAVAYEVLGDLDEALKWAQDAYQRYGNKRDRSYAVTLNNRIYQIEQLRKAEAK